MNKEHPCPGSKISSSCSSELTERKLEEHRVSTLRSCPSCGHEIGCNTDMIGMPAGVKFDPSDQELIHHLQTVVDEGGSGAHPLIGEFIPTIQGENGICYTHPENLPGVRRDGVSKHFFHWPSKAYTNGTRKRRRIHAQQHSGSDNNVSDQTRWHKTGKTRPVMVAGRQKGCKKILVLYTNFGKNRKPEKTNWVMHQYHLGDQEAEKDGELVVSKVFYQTQTRQHVMTRGGEKAAYEMPEAMQDVLKSSAVVLTAQQRQQQRTNQADDGQFTVVAHSKKRYHEVHVGDQETSCDQGELELSDNHDVPWQHQVIVRPDDLHVTPAAPKSITSSGLLNNPSTVISPAVGHDSIVLNRRFHPPQSVLRNEKFEGASAQSETQRRPYRYWPPDRIPDQHG